MEQQTAVEWLQEVIINHLSHEQQMQVEGLFQQAKEMEKEQISKAHYDGYYREDLYDTRQYYNDTYKEDKPKNIHIERSPEWP